MRNSLEILKIVDWDKFVHPDVSRKKGGIKPPFRWVKMYSNQLDTLGHLSPIHFAGFTRLLLLSAFTGNQTPFDPGYIRRRSGVSRQCIEALLTLGLVELVPVEPEDRKTQQNQHLDSENASNQPATDQHSSVLEGRGRDRDKKGGEGSAPPVTRAMGRQPEFDEMLDCCLQKGISSGSDWTKIRFAVQHKFGFELSEKQLSQLGRQINDRCHR